MLSYQKCEDKRQQYVKDLAQIQIKLQSFLANPVSNERLMPKVIEETEEDVAEDGNKDTQATFLGISTLPAMNQKRTEVAAIDFNMKKTEEGPLSPRKPDTRGAVHVPSQPKKSDLKDRSFNMAGGKGSPRMDQPSDRQKKGETGRTIASTAVPGATGRIQMTKVP
jgi:hypothetical protein